MEIRVENLSKEFGSLPALQDVNLTVHTGELVALLGPSGSGKTTLLRVIAGLEVPNQGRILFGQEDATHVPVQRRGVGFVFQHYALFRHMTVSDNIAYGLRVRRRSERPAEADIKTRVGDLLALVQMEGLEKRYPTQLSGGQRQRVALARALAVEPRVLLLDEPFGALDAKVRKDLRRWLRDIHEQTGRTTIFVTHDQEEALELADRVAILKNGRIEQVGTPDEVHEQPVSPFVMSFIGDTSVLRVNMRQGIAWHGEILLPTTFPDVSDGPANLYLRPWDARIVNENDPLAQPAVVVAVRRAASSQRADLKILSSGEVIEIDIPGGLRLKPGEQVCLGILRGRIFPSP